MAKAYTGKVFTGLCINPECKKPIVFKGDIIGFGSIIVDCKHCGTPNKISITLKSIMKMTKVAIAVLFVVLMSFFYKESLARKITCASFTRWVDAQTIFNAHPLLYAQLDKDHDGVACEDLKK